MTTLTSSTWDVEVAVDAAAETGEGPLWDAEADVLWWLDIPGRRLHRYSPCDAGDQVVVLDRLVGSIGLRARGGLVAAATNGFCALDPDNGRLSSIAEIQYDEPDLRMNDGRCDSAGRFFAGTMAFDARPGLGSFYRLDRDHTVTQLFSGTTISNGLDWSPDGGTLYYVDSPLRSIDAFDFDLDAGTVANRRTLVRLEREFGLPDGLCVDAEGWIWVACWRGGAIRRFAPDGSPGVVVELPVSQVTSCAFGGADLGDLYITSGRRHLSPTQLAAERHAGSLFRCRTGHFGKPGFKYGG